MREFLNVLMSRSEVLVEAIQVEEDVYIIENDDGATGNWPRVLRDQWDIAEYIVSMDTSEEDSDDEIDLDHVADAYIGCHAVLRTIPLEELNEGNPNVNIRNARKEKRYAKMDLSQQPPIVVNGWDMEIVDGNHRYRVAKAAGNTSMLCYVIGDGEPMLNESDDVAQQLISSGNFTRADIDDATCGFCGTFALALHRELQKRGIQSQLVVFSEPEWESLPGLVMWRHALVRSGENYYDVRGKVSEDDVHGEFGTHEIKDVNEAQLLKMIYEIEQEQQETGNPKYSSSYSPSKYREYKKKMKGPLAEAVVVTTQAMSDHDYKVRNLTIHHNPGRNDIKAIIENSEEKTLRGHIDDHTGDFYVWDAYVADHSTVSDLLNARGIQAPWPRFIIELHDGRMQPFAYLDDHMSEEQWGDVPKDKLSRSVGSFDWMWS